MQKISPSEHAEQVGFVSWFHLQFPKVLIFAIPNGGLRNKLVAYQLQKEGVVKGVPDLYVPAWRLWIEMKRTKNGRLSKDQKRIIHYLEAIGDHVIVGKGAEDTSRQVMEWLRALKAEKGAGQ